MTSLRNTTQPILTNVVEDLRWRGALYDATEGAEDLLSRQKVTVYNGFDPTAKSLHVGNLVAIMGLVRMQRHGHTPIAVVGGGTGMIGDPSGRSQERLLLDRARIEENVQGIRSQLERFLDFDAKSNPAHLVNNAEWLLESRTIDFLRDVGKHFTVNTMLGRESVQSRIDRADGISFTEFSYMLLQAYDFQVLFDRYGCRMQAGGSDQFGNILAGVDLIRRTRSTQVHGVVYPLITTASGEKFGKSIGGAPTLDPEETSPYRLYQFFLNTEDADVVRYLKLFTLLEPPEIDRLAAELTENPQERAAQRRLAQEMTTMVHGESEMARAERASAALFGGELDDLTPEDLLEIFHDVPSTALPRALFEGDGVAAGQLFVKTGVAASNGEARRLTQQGGLYLNNRRVQDPGSAVQLETAIGGKVLVLRRGARSYHLVQID